MTAPPQTVEVRITRELEAPGERIRVDLRLGGRYELTMIRRDTGAWHR
jgi:hypothetical protein